MGRRCAYVVAVALGALALLAPGAGAAQRTGRWMVVLDGARTARSAPLLRALLARAGVQKAGRGVPELGVATVRGSAAALARLRAQPGVRAVSAEWRRDPRRMPNDPALSQGDDAFGPLPGGAPLEWTLARERFPAAWDVTTGAGAIVGVIDSGIDAGNPDIAGKIASADSIGTSEPATTDPDGHGTHVSGLACAGTGNGVGVAGAGWDCRLAFVKAPLVDENIVAGIDRAVDRGAQAINMSFGGGGPNAALDLAVDRAIARRVVVVAAASNDPVTDQGAPASQLQPGDAPDINAGRGLVVTGANFFDRRAGTGMGPQISLAAYGFYDEAGAGPPGIVSTYPANSTPREFGGPLLGCDCRRAIGGDSRYAYLQGTSMAAPQVTALAALVGNLNPFLSAGEKMRLIKQTARRQGGWSPDLGWGIIDAGAAVTAARRIDRTAPSSRLRGPRRRLVRRGARRAAVRVRWSGTDRPGAPGLIASGVRSYDVYLKRGRGRYHRVRRASRRRSAVLRLRRGVYRLYTRAADRQSNRERPPRRADLRLVVR